MNNANKPAMPSPHFEDDCLQGLTKREQACLTMGVADTGDAELDAIITKSNKQKFAGLAMQGIMANDQKYLTWSDLAKDCLAATDALLKALEPDNE